MGNQKDQSTKHSDAGNVADVEAIAELSLIRHQIDGIVRWRMIDLLDTHLEAHYRQLCREEHRILRFIEP